MATGIRIIQGTLAGVAVPIDPAGSSQSLIIYNFDSSNTYTVTFASGYGTQTLSLPPGYKFGIPGGTSSLTLLGTGAYKVACYSTIAPEVVDLQLIGSDPGALASNHRFSTEPMLPNITGPNASVVWSNTDSKSYIVRAAKLMNRSGTENGQTLSVGNTATIHLLNSNGSLDLVTAALFNDKAGGGGTAPWPQWATPYTFTLGSVANRTIATGNSIILSADIVGAVSTGVFQLQLDLEPVL